MARLTRQRPMNALSPLAARRALPGLQTAVEIRSAPRTESSPAPPEKAAKLPLVLIHTPNCYLRHMGGSVRMAARLAMLPEQSASNAVRL